VARNCCLLDGGFQLHNGLKGPAQLAEGQTFGPVGGGPADGVALAAELSICRLQGAAWISLDDMESVS
jgi:hypothetical protein